MSTPDCKQGFVSSKKTSAAPTTDANKDPESILRLSLPINEKNPIREVQAELEMKMDKALREVKAEKWGKIQGFTKRAQELLAKKEKDILKDVPAESMDDAKELVASIKQGLDSLAKTVDKKAAEPIIKSKSAVLTSIGDLESLMVKAFPYEVPKEYASLPQLKGRAEVEFVIKKADPNAQFDIEGTLYDKAVLKVVIDGYTAPVTGGNFVDLVNRGLYKGMAIQRSDGFVVQTVRPSSMRARASPAWSHGSRPHSAPLVVASHAASARTCRLRVEWMRARARMHAAASFAPDASPVRRSHACMLCHVGGLCVCTRAACVCVCVRPAFAAFEARGLRALA